MSVLATLNDTPKLNLSDELINISSAFALQQHYKIDTFKYGNVLRSLFRTFDFTDSGTIDPREFVASMKVMENPFYTPRELAGDLFTVYTDGHGKKV